VGSFQNNCPSWVGSCYVNSMLLLHILHWPIIGRSCLVLSLDCSPAILHSKRRLNFINQPEYSSFINSKFPPLHTLLWCRRRLAPKEPRRQLAPIRHPSSLTSQVSHLLYIRDTISFHISFYATSLAMLYINKNTLLSES
jgi:hypothetical protein